MKKLLIISWLSFIFSGFICSAPVEPVRTMNVPPAIAIRIDGLIDDDDYGDMQTTEAMNPEGQGDAWDGESDFQANFWVCYNVYFLYIYAEIQDDIEHNYTWNTGDPWTFDSFEVYLQLDTNTSAATTTDSTATQLRICRGLDSIESYGNAARADYLYYMDAQAPGGWIAEVAIPWTCTMPASFEPEDIMDYYDVPIGFDFSGADSDGSGDIGARDFQTAWDLDGQDGIEDLAWNDCSVFGYISLSNLYDSEVIKVDTRKASNSLVEVYPNPTSSYLNINHKSLVKSLGILDASGKLLVTKAINDYSYQLDVNNYAAGMYLLLLYTDNEVVQTRFCIE